MLLDKSTTSRVVATLVRKGYLSQSADAADARATAIEVTKTGRQLYARITSATSSRSSTRCCRISIPSSATVSSR